ncbi:MAG TPA: RluA family pseudouridine synthase [Kiritimatiellia bacterium]|nr:RluA family pseudouridine synthase [Kiritimatiellia bacterium]
MSKRRHAFSPKYRPRGLNILYEDGDILVIDKEEGLLTMSPRRDESRTAERYLTHYLRKGASRSRLRVFVVHRLDRETSGVLVFAKSALAQRRLKDDWKNTEKFYLAAVHGHPSPKSGVITSYLAEDDDQFVRSVPESAKGRFAKTAYSVIRETPALSILKVQLLTGRKNQIRVHFAEKGHPVVGDSKYGQRGRPGARMALHAMSIAFCHPRSGLRMRFETPIPDLFRRLGGGAIDKDWAGSTLNAPSAYPYRSTD